MNCGPLSTRKMSWRGWKSALLENSGQDENILKKSVCVQTGGNGIRGMSADSFNVKVLFVRALLRPNTNIPHSSQAWSKTCKTLGEICNLDELWCECTCFYLNQQSQLLVPLDWFAVCGNWCKNQKSVIKNYSKLRLDWSGFILFSGQFWCLSE